MKSSDSHLSQFALLHAHRDFALITVDATVQQALAQIRSGELKSRIVYFYVVDGDGKLTGVVPTRRLLLSAPTDRVSDIMIANPVSLPDDATMLDASRAFLERRLLALPIVDASRRIVGVIDVDQSLEEVRQLEDRDVQHTVFQLIGVRLADMTQASWPAQFRLRFPWLLSNIAGGLMCAFIAGRYEGLLDKFIALAMFIPVVLALAESVSIQSLTLTLQSWHGRSIPNRVLARRLLQEAVVGLLLGAACGGIVALSAWITQRHGGVALSLFAGITVSITAATTFGLLVPAALSRIQDDPRVASGPLTLALTDVVTLISYFSLATRFLA